MAVIGGDDSPRACARGFQGMLLAVRVKRGSAAHPFRRPDFEDSH